MSLDNQQEVAQGDGRAGIPEAATIRRAKRADADVCLLKMVNDFYRHNKRITAKQLADVFIGKRCKNTTRIKAKSKYHYIVLTNRSEKVYKIALNAATEQFFTLLVY